MLERPYIQITTAAGRNQLVLGLQPISIGRHSENVLTVDDKMASRFHCVIERVPDGYLLRDLGASNGTLVNGRRVKSALLMPGDVVQIGKTQLVLVIPGAETRRGGGSGGAAGDENALYDAMGAASDLEVVDDSDLVDDADLIEVPDGPEATLARFGGGGGGADDGGEEIETLTESDLVEDEPAPPGLGDDDVIPLDLEPAALDDSDYEHALRRMAESAPTKPFGETDVALINPRGQIVHPAGQGPAAGSPRQVVDVFRLLLLVCFRTRVTDIHLEPKGNYYLLRVRVDGVMVDAARLPNPVGVKVGALVKVLSDIDPSQRGTIQEGHFGARVPGPGAGRARGSLTRRVDYRVSFAPAMFGQKLVVRVLDSANAPARLADLKLPQAMERDLNRAIQQDSGMVLVCGPTGSGKTTSLYALIRSLSVRERNVVTIEDPVEIQLDGVTQIPVDEDKDKGFSALLRSVLRQDPDVILVGEIRDAETARTAMQAAITGHLVFSTVHTKDTFGTVFRLLDLGVEPYMLSQGLNVVLAQRLVRLLCPSCKVKQPITDEQARLMGPAAEGVIHLYAPGGCYRCLNTGYLGRRAIFELLTTTEQFRDAVVRSPSPQQLKEALARTNFERLHTTGFRLVAEGVAPFEEMDRAVGM